MNVRAIRQALRTAVEGLGYRAYDTLPELGDLPLAAVRWPDEVRYDTSMGGVSELDIVVTVCVAATDFAEAQRKIDEAMSVPGFGTSIQDYVPPDPKPYRSLFCSSAGFVRQINVGAEALACDFTITITAK